MIKPQSFWHWLAVGFGSGLAPRAPGTFGTLAALPLVVLGWWLLSPLVYVLLTLPLFAVGVYACDRTARDFGIKDPGAIVVDEWVGLWVSAWLLPFHWLNVLLIFVLFRIFDIGKPWPVSWADRRVHGGLGIMLDDLLAGAMACAVLQLGWAVWA